MTFPDHLEAVLGEIESGRKLERDEPPGVTVARFPNQPMRGATTYVTLGVSKALLHQPSGHIRQEYLVAQEGEREPFEVAGVLAAAAERALETGRALARGEVIGPAGPVVEGSDLESVVALGPGYFPESMEVYRPAAGEVPIALVMLVPVSRDEVEFVERRGADAFEDVLVAEDPNLLDWRRASCLTWSATSAPCPDCGRSQGHFHFADGRAVP